MKLKLSVLFWTLLLLSQMACQQGKTKDTETNIYLAGLEKSDSFSKQLEDFEIHLDGPSPALAKDSAKLPATLQGAAEIYKAQSLLENFIVSTEELLELGDERVVVFPEKPLLEVKLQRANKYLGQLYAKSDWMNERSPIQNRDVDMSEFETRLGRMGECLRDLEKLGIDSERIDRRDFVIDTFKKLEVNKLKLIQVQTDEAMRDSLRLRALADRNQYWNLEGLKKLSDSSESLSSVFWMIGDLAKQEAERKASGS